jgi:U3 small nucleolar ribonucleoprotein protein LCP5
VLAYDKILLNIHTMVAITSAPADTAAENTASISDLSSILETLTACLNSASTSLPSADEPEEKSSNPTVLPPADGISLLDTKAELLLSYLQNLIFLVLFQLRGRGKSDSQGGVSQDDIARKLTELRVYIDKGVKPLEGRLKYQIDKVVKAAEDAERATKGSGKAGKKNKQRHEKEANESEQSDQSEEEDDDEEEDEDEKIDEMAYRPNVTAFSKNIQQKSDKEARTTTSKDRGQPSDGIYRPPRIKPTALPTTDSRDRDRDRERRPKKSSVIDEFVSAEMSSAPTAQPSIGSTIQRGGRDVATQKDREREAERRTYEESNFVRLPKESKKERAKRRAQEGPRTGGFGGEEFRLLREGADRIGRLTKRAAGSSSRNGALEKSRKRAFTEDGPRGDGVAPVGQSFEKRRKKVEGWKK